MVRAQGGVMLNISYHHTVPVSGSVVLFVLWLVEDDRDYYSMGF